MSKVETTSKQQREIRDLKFRSHHRAPATTIEWNLMYVSEYLKTHRDFLTARTMMMWSCGLRRRWIRIVIIIIVIYLWLSGFHFFPFSSPLRFHSLCFVMNILLIIYWLSFIIIIVVVVVARCSCAMSCCAYIFFILFFITVKKKSLTRAEPWLRRRAQVILFRISLLCCCMFAWMKQILFSSLLFKKWRQMNECCMKMNFTIYSSRRCCRWKLKGERSLHQRRCDLW